MEKNQLDTGKFHLKNLFSKERFYNIPDYQRPYLWQKEQINDLLDDLYNAYQENKEKEYFIGTMIWNNKKKRWNNDDDDGYYQVSDILDGQQRFITLFLLHAVIRDLVDDKSIIKKVNERLYQKVDVYDGIPDRYRITFDTRNDKDYIDNYVIKNKSTLEPSAKTDSVSITNMQEAIKTMRSWFNKKNIDKKSITDFFKYISNKTLILYLSTSDNLNDAYSLFEVINSRGMQLQSSDILKAQNLKLIEDDQERSYYASKWDDCVNRIKPPFKNFDSFISALICILMGYIGDKNATKKKAFDHMDKMGILKKGISTFEIIDRYTLHFDEIINQKIEVGDKTVLFKNLLNLTSMAGIYYLKPLLLFKDLFGNNHICDFMVKLNNLATMLWLLEATNAEIRKTYFSLIRKITKVSKDGNSVESIINCDELNISYHYANKADFFNKLEEDWGVYYFGNRGNKVRFLLLMLDFILNPHGELVFDLPYTFVNRIVNSEEEPLKDKLGNLILLNRKDKYDRKSSIDIHKINKNSDLLTNRLNSQLIIDMYKNKEISINHQRVVNLLKYYFLKNDISYFK